MIKNGKKVMLLGFTVCLIVFAICFSIQKHKHSIAGNSSIFKSVAVNLNTATEEELDEIPGVGKSLARSIILYREKYGDYVDTSELLDIQGMSMELYEQIAQYICLGGSK